MEDVAAVPDDYRSLARLLPPMMVFPIWIEHALKARAAQRRHQDQGFHRRLPFLGLVLDLWNFGYEIAGILGGTRRRLRGSGIGPSNGRFQPRCAGLFMPRNLSGPW